LLRVVERYYSESAKLLMVVKVEWYESAIYCLLLVSKHSAGPTPWFLIVSTNADEAIINFLLFSTDVEETI